MRPQPRGGGLASQTYILFSLFASFYVIERLWNDSSTVTHLREEVVELSEVIKEQREALAVAISEAELKRDPLFFSIRAAAPQSVPRLQGQQLNLEEVEKEGSSSVHVVAHLEAIEAGRAWGWACSLSGGDVLAGPLKIAVYIDGVLVAHAVASKLVTLPEAARAVCAVKRQQDSAAATRDVLPVGFTVRLPPLEQGMHVLRVFVQLPGAKVEAVHSPAAFVETFVQPDGTEELRRKDAIIVRRNAELVALWSEMRTQLPWRRWEKAALAAAQGGNSGMARDVSGDGGRLLAVVLVHSAPQDRYLRDLLRQSWAPGSAKAAAELRSRLNVAVRFAVAPPEDAPKGALTSEAAATGDMLLLESVLAADPDAKQLLAALAAATAESSKSDAEYYVITRDKIALDLEGIAKYLGGRGAQGNSYFGCMKSGDVVEDAASQWHEPEAGRFGKREKGVLVYPLHAAKEAYALSRNLARYLATSQPVLHSFAFEDTSVGAWLLGLDVTLVDERRFCCDPNGGGCGGTGEGASGVKCFAYYEAQCGGMCDPKNKLKKAYEDCVRSRREV